MTSVILAVLVPLFAAGCGATDRVTYVDPNPDAAYSGIDGEVSGEPVVTFGVDTLQRAKAVAAIRGALLTARTIQPMDPVGAAATVTTAMESELIRIEPRLASTSPRLRRQLRAELVALRRLTTGDEASYARRVRRTVGPVLDQVERAVVPIAARQDLGFRAAVLADSLNDAGLRYEEAFSGADGDRAVQSAYRSAYGLVLHARTRGLTSLPVPQRPRVERALAAVAARALDSPTATSTHAAPDRILEELSSVADLVAAGAGIDTTWPAPGADTADQLRATKRSVAAAAEAWERDDASAAHRHVLVAQQTIQSDAGSSVAAVDPDLVIAVERGVAIDLPDAMTAGVDVASVAAQIDADLDDAISVVETELEQLRASD